METVGIRDLKNRLSAYIRQVRAGEVVLVTDRGEVVAELAPPRQTPADADLPPGLLTLARRGLLTLGDHGDATVYPALVRARPLRRSAAQLLDDERGTR
jgi:prevent-host-death family protein